MKTFLRIISMCIWWHLFFPFLIVITPTLFATNVNIPYFDKPFRTLLFTKTPLLSSLNLESLLDSQYHFLEYMSEFRRNLECSNFDTLALSKGFIALNEACVLIPLVFFISVILSFYLSFLFKRIPFFEAKERVWFVILCIIISIYLVILSLTFLYIGEIVGKWWILLCLLFVWLLGGLVVSIYLIISKRWIFRTSYIYVAYRYLVKYIRLRHPVACLAGIFYNIIVYVYLCIVVANYDNGNLPLSLEIGALPLFVIWSTSLVMWMGPFVRAWLRVFSTDFIDEYYRNKLSRIISDLDKHRVLLGFGGLGLGVQKELLEREESKSAYEPLLDPSEGSSIRYIAKEKVIVDRDERLFDKVFIDPALEKIGIAKLKYDNIPYSTNSRLNITEEEIWIPAVIGDFIDESVIDNCALGRCKFFIDTIEGYEESIRILKFTHDHRETNPKTSEVLKTSPVTINLIYF